MVKYLNKEKFEGNKPLLKYSNDYYPDKFLIKYRKFEPPKDFDLYDGIKGQVVELGDSKIVFGIKASPEEFTKYDFLWCPDGPAFVVHQRVLDKLNVLCPNDIQALPVIIKHYDLTAEKFENREFWLINILDIVDIIDREKSESYWKGDFLKFKKNMYLKDISYMGDHLIARIEEFTPKIIFHPSLAKHFIKSKGIQFLTDEEAPYL